MGWNYLSIPFHLTLHWACDCLWMLRLHSNCVSRSFPTYHKYREASAICIKYHSLSLRLMTSCDDWYIKNDFFIFLWLPVIYIYIYIYIYISLHFNQFLIVNLFLWPSHIYRTNCYRMWGFNFINYLPVRTYDTFDRFVLFVRNGKSLKKSLSILEPYIGNGIILIYMRRMALSKH